MKAPIFTAIVRGVCIVCLFGSVPLLVEPVSGDYFVFPQEDGEDLQERTAAQATASLYGVMTYEEQLKFKEKELMEQLHMRLPKMLRCAGGHVLLRTLLWVLCWCARGRSFVFDGGSGIGFSFSTTRFEEHEVLLARLQGLFFGEKEGGREKREGSCCCQSFPPFYETS